MFFVYKIVNLVNGKIYIGKSKNPQKRWLKHLNTAKRGSSDRRFQVLHTAINKYGKNNFKIEIIFACNDEKECLEKEKYFIAKYNTFKGPGYNCTEGGDGSSGYKHTSEAIEKMKKAKTGIFHGENNPFYGKKHSEETKKILSKKASERKGEKNSFYKKKHSGESKRKIRENQKVKERYFSFQEAEAIRKLYLDSKLSYEDISEKFSTSKVVISDIITYNRAYKSDITSSCYYHSLGNNKRLFTFDQAEKIRKQIFHKKLTIKDICFDLGVSRTTISILINFRKGYAVDYDRSEYKK